ncbi:MAG: DUF4422 domain-containing protein [Bacteroidales bacterium]|nr:DUF4422 domain-containing protein [Bacteroidales bacterium]
MSKNVKILVAAHKADPAIRQDEVYIPIHVGKALHPELDLGFQGDNTGDNISEKNASYCELTAMYWAWKNLKDVDIIGLAHYRRYLNISNDDILNFFRRSGIILPEKFHCRTDNYTNLVSLLTHEEAILAIDTLLKMHPDAKGSIQRYFYQSNRYSVFNMFIADWNTFNEYCSFLFPYLLKLEHRLSEPSYSRLKRNLGYVAEAMFGFWIEYAKVRTKYVPTVDLSPSPYGKGLKKRVRDLQRDLGFILAYLPIHQKPYYYGAALHGLRSQGIDVDNI